MFAGPSDGEIARWACEIESFLWGTVGPRWGSSVVSVTVEKRDTGFCVPLPKQHYTAVLLFGDGKELRIDCQGSAGKLDGRAERPNVLPLAADTNTATMEVSQHNDTWPCAPVYEERLVRAAILETLPRELLRPYSADHTCQQFAVAIATACGARGIPLTTLQWAVVVAVVGVWALKLPPSYWRAN